MALWRTGCVAGCATLLLQVQSVGAANVNESLLPWNRPAHALPCNAMHVVMVVSFGYISMMMFNQA